MSTVLNHKNGLITEERFKKLTPIQWLFHYREIIKERKRQDQEKIAEINMTKRMFETIVKMIESVGMMSNPEIGMKIINDRKNKENLGNLQKGEDELLNYLNEIEHMVPKTIVVVNEDAKKTKFFLKKFKRGIQVDE